MKTAIIALLVVISAVGILSQPVNINYLPKEYYQRQNLPERPGYIPVYIKHDDEPLIKWDDGSHTNVDSDKTKTEQQVAEQEVEKTETPSVSSPEKPQTEQKSKTKKVTEKSEIHKRKDGKE